MFDGEPTALPLQPDWPSLRDTTLERLEVFISDLDDQSAADDVLLWLDRAGAFLSAAKAVNDAVQKRAIAWITVNGPLRVGDVLFVVEHQRTTRCRDVRATLHAAVEALSGDLDAVATLLAANAWKHGACRGSLPQAVYDSLFETQVRSRLASGATAPKELIRIDERWTRTRKPAIG